MSYFNQLVAGTVTGFPLCWFKLEKTSSHTSAEDRGHTGSALPPSCNEVLVSLVHTTEVRVQVNSSSIFQK